MPKIIYSKVMTLGRYTGVFTMYQRATLMLVSYLIAVTMIKMAVKYAQFISPPQITSREARAYNK